MSDVEAWLEGSWQELGRQVLATVGNLRTRILADMNHRQGRDELSAWLFYNAGFLVQTRNRRFAIDLSLPKEMPDSREPLRLEGFQTLEALLVTHQHADHCNPELVAGVCRMTPDVRVLAPAEAAEVLFAGGVPAKRVTVVAADERIELGGMVVSTEAGDHMHESVSENLVYTVIVDGFTLVHTGDNRNHELTFHTDADVVLFGMFCEPVEGASFTWGLADIEATVEQVRRMRPRHVVCCHLNEVGHAHNFAWRFMHAGLVKERLWIREPGIVCHLPAPGERVTCESVGA